MNGGVARSLLGMCWTLIYEIALVAMLPFLGLVIPVTKIFEYLFQHFATFLDDALVIAH